MIVRLDPRHARHNRHDVVFVPCRVPAQNLAHDGQRRMRHRGAVAVIDLVQQIDDRLTLDGADRLVAERRVNKTLQQRASPFQAAQPLAVLLLALALKVRSQIALNVLAAAACCASFALRLVTVGSPPRWTFRMAAAASARASASEMPFGSVSFFDLPPSL